ncbi:MAG TPA: hypothetical protein VMB85_06840 [Bryobacteraceae bacterium]|nr:hypothetical protein [Bryobacteraceae bacterium]
MTDGAATFNAADFLRKLDEGVFDDQLHEVVHQLPCEHLREVAHLMIQRSAARPVPKPHAVSRDGANSGARD